MTFPEMHILYVVRRRAWINNKNGTGVNLAGYHGGIECRNLSIGR